MDCMTKHHFRNRTIRPAGANPHLSNDWIDSPGGTSIHLTNAQIGLRLDDPSEDVPTQGDRAKYLDTYLVVAAEKLAPGKGTFALGSSGNQFASTVFLGPLDRALGAGL
jgi:hypothetical protein